MVPFVEKRSAQTAHWVGLARPFAVAPKPDVLVSDRLTVERGRVGFARARDAPCTTPRKRIRHETIVADAKIAVLEVEIGGSPDPEGGGQEETDRQITEDAMPLGQPPAAAPSLSRLAVMGRASR